MSKKIYPLKIENIGEDDYKLMSRGHHNFKDFMKIISEYRNWSMGFPIHIWFKAVPTRKQGYNCIYVEVNNKTRGAFPVTYTQEAYGKDKYEQV